MKSRARIPFINVYAKFLRDGTKKCMCAQNEVGKTRTVLCAITQRHLKTFIEEYLGATQVFNHSVSVFTRGLQSTYILKASSLKRRKRPFPAIRSFAPPFSSYTYMWIIRFIRDLRSSLILRSCTNKNSNARER